MIKIKEEIKERRKALQVRLHLSLLYTLMRHNFLFKAVKI